jgi:hypothetical protein
MGVPRQAEHYYHAFRGFLWRHASHMARRHNDRDRQEVGPYHLRDEKTACVDGSPASAKESSRIVQFAFAGLNEAIRRK